MKFEGWGGAEQGIVTCTNDDFDDDMIAAYMEGQNISGVKRVGNNFKVNNELRCGDDLESEITIACEGPINGVSTCVNGPDKGRHGLWSGEI